MDNKMTAEQALDAVRNVLQRAYNSAEPVCCGRAGTECCGSPEPEWSEYDQQIMNDLQPVEAYLSQALSAPRVPAGWRPIETAPMDGTAVLVMRDIWPGTKSGRAEECNGYNTYVAEWWQEEGDCGKWVCYMDSVSDPLCPIVPTHWMPLPHPPSLLTASPEPVADDTQKLIADLRAEVEALREALSDAASYARHSDYDWDMGFIRHVDALLEKREGADK